MREANLLGRRASVRSKALRTKALVLVETVSLVFGLEARAQSRPRKFELGAQFVGYRAHSTKFPDGFPAGVTNHIDDFVLGGGLRAGYRIAQNLAVEAEVNIFQRPPTDDPATPGKWSQGFFGLKLSKPLNNISLFAKVRPGYARFDGVTSAIILPDGSVGVNLIKDNHFFAVDIGGGVELYPSHRTIIRLDAGDAVIRYTARPGRGLDPVSNLVRRTYYGHNFLFSAGFAVRF
ncbi:MAG TPA: hypothetical protein VI837_08995 [Blastocatellia bacterium]|nr:hypothetical protein [Blastocatellia bacterium]